MDIKNKDTGEVIITVEKNSDGIYDLHGADLNGADLAGSNLIRANLSEADLTGADLRRANCPGQTYAGPI